jgi:hypothetical protein
VEVVIDAELEAAQSDVLLPDAVQEDKAAEHSTRPIVEIMTSPARSWADILIALWLVLVASAVLATLLWRR